jgi:hypothetical protein
MISLNGLQTVQLMKTLLLSLSLFIITATYGQNKADSLRYGIEIGAIGSTTQQATFWSRTNQFGEVPLESNVVTFRGDVQKEYGLNDFKNKNFSYGFGVRGVANIGRINQVLLSEVYGKLRFKALELSAGRRKNIFGLLEDNTVGIGNYIWAGNALPIPKVELALPNYTPVVKNGFIAVKGNYAHGWFGSADSVKNYFLHEKSLYVRFGKPRWNLKLHGGFNHQVQWGGSPTVPFLQGGTNNFITTFANDLDAYLNVVAGRALTDDGNFTTTGNISGEGGNRAGNHLGTLDLAVEYNSKSYDLLLYRQSIYEDGSLAALSNVYDGLTGLIITRKNTSTGLKKITLEYLNTTNQGGSLSSLSNNIPELRGRDNYFNNATYEDSWTYKGFTLGTPFLMPINATPNLGLSSDTLQTINSRYILNNRVHALVLGTQINLKKVESLTKVSFSRNLGNYTFPIDINQFSIQEQLSFMLKENQVNLGVSYDNLGILNQNWGFSLVIRREFGVSNKRKDEILN